MFINLFQIHLLLYSKDLIQNLLLFLPLFTKNNIINENNKV
jgi:hypothetical protein